MQPTQHLVWHALQLQPGYASDTEKLLGKSLNHDDSVNDRAAGVEIEDMICIGR